jgi:poly-gamma-glutamate synthesis protein (capsule biosynthesis protein)
MNKSDFSEHSMKTNIKKMSLLILSAIILLCSCSARDTDGKSAGSDIYGAATLDVDSCSDDTSGIPDPEPDSITLLMAGDLLLHRFVQISGEKDDGRYDYNSIFENVSEEISSADIAIVNQETPLAGEAFGLSGCINQFTELEEAF